MPEANETAHDGGRILSPGIISWESTFCELRILPIGGLYCITYTKNLISYTKLSMLKYYTYVTYDMLILNVSNIAITF